MGALNRRAGWQYLHIAIDDYSRLAYAELLASPEGRYVNYLDDDEDEFGSDPVRAAYGPNYERLVDVKTKYDPENLFHLNFNIPPRPA